MREFRAIYEQEFEWVWHALRRLSVPERDLPDAAQNVFLVVHRRLPEFEGRSRLRTWIFQICRRVASDYRRSASVRREVATDTEALAAHADRRVSSEREVQVAERSRVARALLDGLPEAQREVFLLHELEQLSGDEIAQELGVPVGTVRSRLRLARQAFRRGVAAWLGEGEFAEGSGPRASTRPPTAAADGSVEQLDEGIGDRSDIDGDGEDESSGISSTGEVGRRGAGT
ncbi:MAG TPA: RNA polymerase sigma factor [Polyangiaceae bacterium]|nr:RNA polymerase sigma factor [Polyangiaceae bacterium]